MKIKICEEAHEFKIFIPTFLLCTKTGMKKLCQSTGMDEDMINMQYLKENRDALKKILKKFKGLELFSAEEADGDSIRVIL